MTEPMLEFLGSVAQDDNNLFDTTSSQVVDAGFDNGLLAEREQRFERAHSFRAAGGEDYCCYIAHGDLRLEILQSAQSVLTGHLFAPLVNEVSVIERARLYISGFRCGANLLVR